VAAPQVAQRGGVEHREVESELLGHLVAPLQRERRGADDEDAPRPVPQQQLLGHQPRLDRLAETHVIGHQEVHPRHRQCTGDRFELVLLDRDAGAEGGLQSAGIRAGDGAPADGVEKGTELLRVVPTLAGRNGQLRRRNDLAAGFDLPDDRQFLAEIVADIVQRHQGATGQPGRGQLVDGLGAAAQPRHDPLLSLNAYQLTDLWIYCGHGHSASPLGRLQ